MMMMDMVMMLLQLLLIIVKYFTRDDLDSDDRDNKYIDVNKISNYNDYGDTFIDNDLGKKCDGIE